MRTVEIVIYRLIFKIFFHQKLAQLAQSKDSIDKLFVEAQTNEKKLLAMTKR